MLTLTFLNQAYMNTLRALKTSIVYGKLISPLSLMLLM